MALVILPGLLVSAQQRPAVGARRPPADGKSDSASVKKIPVRPYTEVIPATAVTRKGFMLVHSVEGKYFFEVPDSILGKEILITNWLSGVPEGSPVYGGEKASESTFYFEKGPGNTLYLRLAENINQADTTQMIYKAVRNANVDPILMAFDIRAYGPDHKSSVIEVTDLFQKDNTLTSIGMVKMALSLGGLVADKTFINSMHAYPLNIEVSSTRTYTAMPPKPGAGGPGGPAAIDAAKEAGVATLQVRNSIMLLPEIPMKQRQFDPRVGYFAGGYSAFSDEEQRVKERLFIVRYRLEPKEEDIERYKRGELVEPKKQIVYYTDPATPKQWRPYIIAGINDWSKAFEQAGFKNAIVGKEWPENDTTMSTEDVRYSIVRYLPSETANAYGPNIHDPRTGEVLQSYVGWYHNIMKLLHDWYMVQAGAIDPAARKMVYSDSLMGSLIRFASSHEIGHTLGLRHNMGSSSTTPVEKLRDKAWLKANGHTPSIMDYARFNYVAQPEDSLDESCIFPRIGAYDKWAIQWGYRWIGEDDAEKDKAVVGKWILDSLKANPRLWFGGEGRNNDPRCQTEDIGDNSITATAYALKNLRRVMDSLPSWTSGQHDFNKSLYDGYSAVTSQYYRYMMHVAKNVGGICETIKSVEQAGAVYAPSPKDRQREAIEFLDKHLFATQDWMINRDLLNRMSKSTNGVGYEMAQKRILDQLISQQTLYTLLQCSQRFGPDSTYRLETMLNDLKAGIWGELGDHRAIDPFRRDLQKEYVMQSLRIMRESLFPAKSGIALFFGLEENFPILETTDVPSVLAEHLKTLRAECLKALPLATDKASRMHLQYLADIIRIGLNNRFKKDKTGLFGE
jgi:hypothetical protein